MNISILDIGTNTIILLIAEVAKDKTYKIIHDECQIARLGEGIHAHPEFLPEAQERAFAILKNYKNSIAQFACEKIIAVGTAACRNARNAHLFIDRVKKELGIEIQVISGEKEAELIHLGSVGGFEKLSRPILILDIGGGSTEFIFDDGKSTNAKSLPFGVVKLTERFLHTDSPTETETSALKNFVADELKLNLSNQRPATSDQRLVPSDQRLSLIATAGTPTTLAALVKGLTHYDPDKVHGTELKRSDLQNVTKRLAAMKFAERCKIPCLPEKRADVIIAGLLILDTVMDYFEIDSLWVSDRGLRFGVLEQNLALIHT